MDSETTAHSVYNFTVSDTTKLIKLRTENDVLFDGRRNGAKAAWSLILNEMGLEGIVSTERLAKKWENLKQKYKGLKYPAPGMEKEAEKGIATWHWFSLLDKALGNQFSSSPVVTTTEDSFASLPNKRVCLVQLGNNGLERLPNTLLADGTKTVEAPTGDHCESVMTQFDTDLETEIGNLSRERLGLEREQAEVERERLLLEREKQLLERERIAMERDKTQLKKDWATIERDRAAVERDKVCLEKDMASLEREKVAVARERERLKKEHKKNTSHTEADSTAFDDRQKLRSLFEKLIEKF